LQKHSKNSNPILQFLIDDHWRMLRHLLLIVVLLLNYDLFSYNSFAEYAHLMHIETHVFYTSQWINMLFSLGLIYINLYFLFPTYFKKGMYVKYFSGIFIIALFFYIVNILTQQINIHFFGKLEVYAQKVSFGDFVVTVMYPIVFLGATTGYKVFKSWIADQEKFAALEKEKLSSELMQLKNQVNPHFLFNTLNNLHVLTQTNPEKASNIVLGLSDVLRYQIYDSQHETVPLVKDIEMIEQYLELEKIRRNNLAYTLLKKGNLQAIRIPPLLFTNFIDNAIKHSNTTGLSNIDIQFELIKNELHVEIKNSKSNQKMNINHHGIGLPNIKKRLHLLYGEDAKLNIIDTDTIYKIQLSIPI
jgi:two-component system, LytTR family, sensor kinase